MFPKIIQEHIYNTFGKKDKKTLYFIFQMKQLSESKSVYYNWNI